MNEEAIRGITEAAFKDRFDLEVVRINVKPDVSHYGDPIVDVQIVYDDERGKAGRLGGDGILGVIDEVSMKVQADPSDDPGFPILHFIALSDLGRRSPELA